MWGILGSTPNPTNNASQRAVEAVGTRDMESQSREGPKGRDPHLLALGSGGRAGASVEVTRVWGGNPQIRGAYGYLSSASRFQCSDPDLNPGGGIDVGRSWSERFQYHRPSKDQKVLSVVSSQAILGHVPSSPF